MVINFMSTAHATKSSSSVLFIAKERRWTSYPGIIRSDSPSLSFPPGTCREYARIPNRYPLQYTKSLYIIGRSNVIIANVYMDVEGAEISWPLYRGLHTYEVGIKLSYIQRFREA